MRKSPCSSCSSSTNNQLFLVSRMGSEWKHPEDVERDIWYFSEISAHEAEMYEPTPEPILQYNARIGANHNISIFDPHPQCEDVAYIVPGRGRGRVSKIIKPGLPVNASQDEEEDIKRRLRQVSGLGYSNELIEKPFKKPISRDQEFCDVPEVEYVVSPFSNNKSPSPTNFLCIKPDSSRGSTPSLSSGPHSPMKEIPKRPPPLSLILKKGKEKTVHNNNENTSKSESDEQKENVIKKSQLRPDAPEFKLTPRTSWDTGQNGAQALSIYKRSPTLRDRSSDSSTEEMSWRNRNNNQRSEPLSWRLREHDNVVVSPSGKVDSPVKSEEKDFTFRAGLSWRSLNKNFYSNRETNSDYTHDEYSYRQAALSSRKHQNDFTRSDTLFDIKSDSDFPTL